MRTEKKPLVGNAADPDQVRRAKKSEEYALDEQQNDLRVVLSRHEGRRFLWRWLGQLGVNKSVFVQSSEIYYRAGKQDAGHALMAEIIGTDPELYLLMQQEAIERDRNDVEPAGAHKPAEDAE